MNAVGQPFRAPTPQAAPVPVTPPVQIDPEGYITGAQAQAIQREALAQAQPHYQSAIDMAASNSLALVRREYAKDFSRFGPEISAELANLPKNLWSVDNIEKIVKYVKVGHLDELAREQAEHLVQTMEPSMRSIGSAGTAPAPVDDNSFSAQWQKLPPEWRAKAEKDGITESVVREFCAGNDMTVGDFFKNFASTAIGEGAAR